MAPLLCLGGDRPQSSSSAPMSTGDAGRLYQRLGRVVEGGRLEVEAGRRIDELPRHVGATAGLLWGRAHEQMRLNTSKMGSMRRWWIASPKRRRERAAKKRAGARPKCGPPVRPCPLFGSAAQQWQAAGVKILEGAAAPLVRRKRFQERPAWNRYCGAQSQTAGLKLPRAARLFP